MSDVDPSYLDPRGDTPVGSAWPIGNMSANDPLVDWASNLHKDDLAKWLQNPDEHSQDMAARGIAPPTPEQMQAIHDHNDAMGTPSRASRAELQADNGPFNGPVGDPSQGNLTRGLKPGAVTMSTTGIPQSKDLGTVSGPLAEKIQKSWQGSGQPPTEIKKGERSYGARPSSEQAVPRPLPPAEKVVPVPVPVQPQSPAQQGPMYRPGPEDQPAQGPAKPPPPTLQTPSPLEPAAAGAAAAKKKPGEEEPQTKLQKAGDAISELGKAMQGVKAPEPLKPPAGGPSVRSTQAAGAPALTQLAGMLSGVQGGQVPASALPVLRLLGRA